MPKSDRSARTFFISCCVRAAT